MSDNMTSSAKIISKANALKETTDSLGRVIKYKKLKPSEQMNLSAILGANMAINQVASGMATAAFRIVSIDGEPMPVRIVETYDELLENMDFAGDEGLVAMYRLDNPFYAKVKEKEDADAAAKSDADAEKTTSSKLNKEEVAEIVKKAKAKE